MAIFFVTLQDISLDALALKELKVSRIISLIQATSQGAGVLFGSLLVLKLTSQEFANFIGKEQAITSLQVIIVVIAAGNLIPSVLIHFLFH